MADSLNQIAGALAQTAAPKLVRAWNRLAVLLQSIEKKNGGGQGGGQNVAWNVLFGGATVNGFSEGADIKTAQFTQDPPTMAKLEWGQYQSAFSLTNKEINAAAANVGNAIALEDMFAERLFDALTAIVDKINTDVFAGTGTTTDVDGNPVPGIWGLDTALAATGTYAGISKAVYSEWAGNARANGGNDRQLTLKLLAQLEQDIYTASGEEPDFLVTDPAIYTAYESIFTATMRTVSDGAAPVQNFQGSAAALNWRGRRIVRDRRSTAKKFYMLRPDGLALHVLPWAMARDGVQTQMANAPSSNGERQEPTGLQVHVYPLARTGSAVKFVAEVYTQLCVRRPNEHGILADVLET